MSMSRMATQSTQTFTTSQLEFSIRLLQQQSASECFVCSPMSISAALALLHAGAIGQTKNEIQNLLLPGFTDKDFEKYTSEAVKTLIASDYVLLANHVFVNKKVIINESYLEHVKQLYSAGATQMDFAGGWFSKSPSKIINAYVKANTKGFIQKIVNRSDMRRDTTAVLVNAIYFQCDWYHKFNKKYTKPSTFYTSESSTRRIPFMHDSGKRLYAENEMIQLLCLEYDDASYQLNVFLPKDRYGLKPTLEKLTGSAIHSLVSTAKKTFLGVSLPKFKTETSADVRELLESLGMDRLFDGCGDLSGIADSMKVGSLVHKAIIDVDEDGTTAAAATAELVIRGMPPKQEFNADHPFLYFLSKDNLPLFVGIYA